MISVTPKAITKIRETLEKNHAAALRLGVAGGGCSGMSYKFRLEQEPRPTDNVLEFDGVKVVVDPRSYEILKDLTLDYRESLMETGFVFRNPNAQHTCSCGKSFA